MIKPVGKHLLQRFLCEHISETKLKFYVFYKGLFLCTYATIVKVWVWCNHRI